MPFSSEVKKIRLSSFLNQAEFAKILLPTLTEKETSVYKRGRNAAPKCTPKNGTVADYHSATGLESLFGYLYLKGENERIGELFDAILHFQQIDTAEE